jgi:hypothetical protein
VSETGRAPGAWEETEVAIRWTSGDSAGRHDGRSRIQNTHPRAQQIGNSKGGGQGIGVEIDGVGDMWEARCMDVRDAGDEALELPREL